MPTVSGFFTQFSGSSRRKRSRPALRDLDITAPSETSGATEENKREHPRAVSEPLPNGYHENANGTGTSQPTRNGQSRDVISTPKTQAERPSANTTTGSRLQGLAGAAIVANSNPKLSKVEKALDAVESMGLAASVGEGKAVVLANIMTTALQSTNTLNAVKDQITSLVENTKPIIDALHAVAKIHPFIGVAVTIFEGVWQLEMTRRGNNQKVLALHIEMRNMISVLVQLRDVKDPDLPGPDGKTIDNRMKMLVDQAADVIQKCANACDEYTKKQIIVKVLSGPVWENRLANFGVQFDKIRSEFQFQLTVHNSVTLDEAAKKIAAMQASNDVMAKNIEQMMEMLHKLSTAEESRLQKIVQKKGGVDTVLENETLLKEVSKDALANAPVKSNGQPYTFKDLQEDLKADIEELLEKNLDLFSAKMQMQQEKLARDIKDGLEKSTDKLIAKMDSGPHERILDPDISKLWKDMQWRTSVKTSVFVMNLREYFHEQWALAKSADGSNSTVSASLKSEEWAIPYLDIQRLQSIREAIDEDASGFVTINEVNYFIMTRPAGWGLLKWMAYWAACWQQTLNYYCGKIRQVLAKMFAILPNITDVNLPYFHKYLDEIYQAVRTLEASINPCLINEALQSKFRDYVQSEEDRLKANLERINYNIDAMDTLALVSGNARLGKWMHCVLYLLLERHFEIFRLAQAREKGKETRRENENENEECEHANEERVFMKEIDAIHPDELVAAASSIHFIMVTYNERYELLLSVFRQQRVDPRHQFETWAHGMFRYRLDPRSLWSQVKTEVHPNIVYDESLEDKTVYDRTDKILTYGLVKVRLDYHAYDPYPPKLEPFGPVHPLLVPILGTWNILQYRSTNSTIPAGGMVTMTLLPDMKRGQTYFKASSRSSSGDFAVQGHFTAKENGIINLSFRLQFKARVSTQYWNGDFDPHTETISGSLGTSRAPKSHSWIFVMKRTDPLDLRFRPAPKEFLADKSAALWKYVRQAIPSQVQRQAYKWSYFDERARIRERFFELYVRHHHFGNPLDANEQKEWREIRRNLTAADFRFYQSYIEYEVAKSVRHHIPCKRCHGQIGKARNICLQCQDRDTSETFDLCSPCQRESEFNRETVAGGKPHHGLHEVVKVRRVIHIRDFGRLYQDANKTLDFARRVLAPEQRELRLDSEFDHDSPTQEVNSSAMDSPTDISRSLDSICTHCNDEINVPCWCYINAEVGTFICDKCEEKGKAEKHDLVRCQSVKPHKPLGIEERLANLERRFDEKLQFLTSKVDICLQQMDTLLRVALSQEKSRNAIHSSVDISASS